MPLRGGYPILRQSRTVRGQVESRLTSRSSSREEIPPRKRPRHEYRDLRGRVDPREVPQVFSVRDVREIRGMLRSRGRTPYRPHTPEVRKPIQLSKATPDQVTCIHARQGTIVRSWKLEDAGLRSMPHTVKTVTGVVERRRTTNEDRRKKKKLPICTNWSHNVGLMKKTEFSH